MSKPSVESPWPETLLLVLVQVWQFHNGGSRTSWGFYLLAWGLGSLWFSKVAELVPQPYLDEVFHIPQAQIYCDGRFDIWDGKITTPPGLYLLAALYHTYLRYSVCSVYSLRRMNLVGVTLIHLVASSCRRRIEASNSGVSAASSYAYHTAVNVALFPVLFFFSALFYTDVYSALLVLLAYQHHLSRLASSKGIWSDIWTVCLGVSTLFMRQTNVFWVVVYMGGLEAVHVVRTLKKAPGVETPECTTLASAAKFYAWRYSLGDIHDPPLNISWPDDWLFCVISIAIAAACHPVKVLNQIWPYISIVTLFGGFVAWNGGVVLGDKSNHVATLHLAQMLYLWPFFAFFSAPLVIPSAMTSLSSFYEAVRNAVHRTPSTMAEANSKKSLAASKSAGLRVADFFVRRIFYACFLVGALGLSVCIVGYNTIIHPFTLADNRHYMFYVFRYTIRRSQLVRFSLIGAYMLSGHLIWNRLAGNPSAAQGRLTPLVNRPFASVTSARKRDAQNEDVPSPATASPATSTALLWLGTTTLSLVTAPLVEPRYFILPWIFWRLLVPAWPTPSTLPERLRGTPGVDWLSSVMRRVDLTLALETTWFVVINLATFWVFLYRPYQWRGADGQLLDEGRWQRFMW